MIYNNNDISLFDAPARFERTSRSRQLSFRWRWESGN